MNDSNKTCSDTLWLSVMKNIIEKHPGDTALWRIAPPTQADCSLCKEQGGGVLIKCSNEKCKKEYHLDCAFNEGGLSLSEEGELKFQCENHFKPIVFCTCRQSYEETR